MKESIKAFPPLAMWIVVKDWWKSIMTIQHSPLRKLPPQLGLMVFSILSLMWSGIFASIINNPHIFGWTAGAHILIVCGIFITAIVYEQAEKNATSSHMTKYSGRAANGEHE